MSSLYLLYFHRIIS